AADTALAAAAPERSRRFLGVSWPAGVPGAFFRVVSFDDGVLSEGVLPGFEPVGFVPAGFEPDGFVFDGFEPVGFALDAFVPTFGPAPPVGFAFFGAAFFAAAR